MRGVVTSYPQLWQVFGTHKRNLDANGASHDGHLILPCAKAHDARSHGTASTTSKKASAVQTRTRTENVPGNSHRQSSTTKATTSNGAKELASRREVRRRCRRVVKRVAESDGSIAASNRVVAGPTGSDVQARSSHTVFPHPRRVTNRSRALQRLSGAILSQPKVALSTECRIVHGEQDP